MDDVYYILFRHKWKIIAFSVLGFVAAGVFLLIRPMPYVSEARLMIRYVLDESGSVGPVGASSSRVRTPDERGDSIINSEIEILTSFDLAKTVAENVGPDKILGKQSTRTNDIIGAAAVVANGIEVDAGKKDSVIRIVFKNKDAELVQPVLQELVESYIRKHLDVHQTGGALDDFLVRKTDELRGQLSETEKELRDRRNAVNVVSIEDARKNCLDRESKINLDILAAQAELAERTATLDALIKASGSTAINTNPPATNAAPVIVGTATTNPVAIPLAATTAEVPPEIVEDNKRLLDRLDSLWKNYTQLRAQFTEENKLVKDVRKQIQETTEERRKLDVLYPRLLATSQPAQALRQTPTPTAASPAMDLTTESTHVVGLQSKIAFLQAQLTLIHSQITNLNAAEPALVELERKRIWEETNYHYFEVRREQSRINESLGMGKVSNIGRVQSPTPPIRDSKKTMKTVAGIAFGGIAFGIVLAFLIEMVLDPSLKRTKDIENKAKCRVFLTVPNLKRGLTQASLESSRPRALIPETSTASSDSSLPSVKSSPDLGNALWSEDHALHLYYEALRDRIISDFEQRNLTHKPKLIAVTSCSAGAGVTTMAIGLAASLSKIGDGNVLLVDMNLQGGAAQGFYKGKPGCDIDDALDDQSRDGALVQENLYVVTGQTANRNTNGKPHPDANSDTGQRIFPKNFATMVPKLHASNYDYIIFDMPPVSQTSITARLAKLMDLNLVVVESEKTSTESAKRAMTMLNEVKAEYSAVLNKTRTYVPQFLNHELM